MSANSSPEGSQEEGSQDPEGPFCSVEIRREKLSQVVVSLGDKGLEEKYLAFNYRLEEQEVNLISQDLFN